VSILLSLATLPLTIIQLQTLFGFGARPVRLDYLVFLWAVVPWLYRRSEPFDWLRPGWWRAQAASAIAALRPGPSGSGDRHRRARTPRLDVPRRVRDFLGLRA
jgi:hypothetical protein